MHEEVAYFNYSRISVAICRLTVIVVGVLLCLCHPTMSAKASCFLAIHLLPSFLCSSEQVLSPRYLMNGLNSFFYKNDNEYLPAPTNDLIRFPRFKPGCHRRQLKLALVFCVLILCYMYFFVEDACFFVVFDLVYLAV